MSTPSPTPYDPAPYIIATSGLSAEQLKTQFESFKGSLRYVSVAPELVFERILGNLCAVSPGSERGQIRDDRGLSIERPQATAKASAEDPDHDTAVITEVQRASKPVSFSSGLSEVPAAVINFTWMGKSSISRPSNSSTLGVKIARYSRNGGLDHNGCRWPDAGYNISGSLSGIYNTAEECRGQPLRSEIQRTITFTEPFMKAPHVLIWLTGLDMHYGEMWKVSTSVITSNSTKFTFCIKTIGKVILYSAGVSWLAYEDADLTHGQFTVPAHAFCQTEGIHDFRDNPDERRKRLKQILVVDEIAVSGALQCSLTVYPNAIAHESVPWTLTSSMTGSAFCVLGLRFILAGRAPRDDW